MVKQKQEVAAQMRSRNLRHKTTFKKWHLIYYHPTDKYRDFETKYHEMCGSLKKNVSIDGKKDGNADDVCDLLPPEAITLANKVQYMLPPSETEKLQMIGYENNSSVIQIEKEKEETKRKQIEMEEETKRRREQQLFELMKQDSTKDAALKLFERLLS